MQTFSQWIESQNMRVDMPIPDGIVKLNKIFTAAGHMLLVAGGAVRDFVLKKEPKDYDLATDATPDEVMQILKDAGIKRTDQVGEQFGVVIAKIDGEEYEIATFRTDLEAGRQTQVQFIRDPKADAMRRDLTMNALFYDINKHEILDFVGGVDDIENGRVRVVGDPMDRFGEDPLRVLRLLRFHARFNSSPAGIDEPTQKAIHHFVGNGLTDKLGKKVPPERIRDEFKKGMKSALIPVNFLKLYDAFGILRKYLLPGFKNYNTQFINVNDPLLAIASILKNNTINDQFVETLRAAIHENSDVDRILYYLKMLNLKRDVRFFSKLSPQKPEATHDAAVDLITNLLRHRPDISDEELEQWARWFHMPLDLVRKFRNYQYRAKVTDVPGASEIPPSALLGKYIKGYNAWNALRSIGKMPNFKEWLAYAEMQL